MSDDIHAFLPLCADSSSVRQKDTKSTHAQYLLSPESSLQSLIDEHCTHLGTDHFSESVPYFDTADSWMLMEPQLNPNLNVVTTQGAFH